MYSTPLPQTKPFIQIKVVGFNVANTIPKEESIVERIIYLSKPKLPINRK